MQNSRGRPNLSIWPNGKRTGLAVAHREFEFSKIGVLINLTGRVERKMPIFYGGGGGEWLGRFVVKFPPPRSRAFFFSAPL